MPDEEKDTQVGGVNITGDTVNVKGGINAQVTAGRDIIVANHIHYHTDKEPQLEEKPRLPGEPETVLVAAGPFLMGRDDGPDDEAPRHQVVLDAYHIGRTPVTHAQYLHFVQATGHLVSGRAGWKLARVGKEPPKELLDHPMVGVSWDDAQAYCQWLWETTGRPYRLPTEAEWEKAASWDTDPNDAQGGGVQRSYPWSDAFDAGRCNSEESGLGRTTPVRGYSPQGDSAAGCADMAGNVSEWTSTLWGAEYAQPDHRYSDNHGHSESPDPYRPYREYRVCRGGSYLDDRHALRCSARGREVADEQLVHVGFRVARSA